MRKPRAKPVVTASGMAHHPTCVCSECREAATDSPSLSFHQRLKEIVAAEFGTEAQIIELKLDLEIPEGEISIFWNPIRRTENGE